MKKTFLFKHAQLVTPTGTVKGDLLVFEGKILAIGEVANGEYEKLIEKNGEHAGTVVDCMGMYLLPGAIDMHVHFRDPGDTHKEDFDTGSRAAIAGGVTTVVDMPNTKPPVLSVAALEAKKSLAREKSHVNTYFYFGASQEYGPEKDSDNCEEIKKALADPLVLGLKIYTARSTGGLLVTQTQLLEKMLTLATKAGKFSIVHAEDSDEVDLMESRFANAIEPRTHSLIRNPMTAYAATKRIIHLAKKVGARVHITHLSTALEVDELVKCGTTGMQGAGEGNAFRVSADATPHHLFLTDEDYSQWGNMVKVNPPLRFEEDKDALWIALKKGIITAVATDHAPHTRAEKTGQYTQVPAGIPGVELMVPLLLDSVNHGELTLSRVVELVAQNPAKILGLTSKGALEVGFDADLMLVDMNREQKVGEHKFGEQHGSFNGYFSKAGWSPYEGRVLKGWPVKVWVNGEER